MPRLQVLVPTLLALAISALGGLALHMLGVPAGILMGGAMAVSVAAIAGVRVAMPVPLRDMLFVVIGLMMGASVAPETLSLIGQWPITLMALVIELVIIVMVCGFVLMRLFGLDTGTSYLSSFPGHLSFIIGLSSAGVGDPRQILVMQTIRVILLTLCVPIGALFLPVGNFDPGLGAQPMSLVTLGMAAAACAFAGWIFTRMKVPAGYVLGSMAVATLLKLTGNFEGQLPPILVTLAFIGMGALIGSRFAGITGRELSQATLGGLMTTVITVTVTTLMALGLTLIVDMPFGQLWLGLSPGALESMGALAIALGYDTAFVAAHHVARLMLLTIAIPAVVLLVRVRAPTP